MGAKARKPQRSSPGPGEPKPETLAIPDGLPKEKILTPNKGD